MNSERAPEKPVIESDLHKSLRDIFEGQFRKQFPVFMVLLVIAVTTSVLRSLTEGWRPLFTLHVSVPIIISLLAFFGRREKGFFYGGMIIAVIFIVGAGNLLGIGMVGMGMLLLLVTITNVTLFFGKKYGFFIIAIDLMVITLVGYLYIRKIIPVSEDIAEYVRSVRGWTTQAAGFLLFGFYTVIAINVVQSHLFGLISEIRRKESQLRIKDERYNAMLQNIPGVVYHCLNDEHWTMKFISDEIEKLSGYAADEFINNGKRSYADIIHKDDRLMVEQDVAQALENGEPFTLEYRIVDGSGTVHWVREKGRGSINEEDGEVHLDGVILDVTDEKMMELALRESEQRYRLLTENLPSVVWVTDETGKSEYISPNVDNVYGFSAEEVLTHGEELWLGRIHPDDIGKVHANFNALFTEGKPFDVQYRIKHKSGEYIWLHDQANLTENIGGKNKAYGVFSDITERRQFEERLEESELKYRSLFEAANDAIFIMKGPLFIDCNGEVLELFGCAREQIIGISPVDFSPEFQPDGTLSEAKAKEKLDAALTIGPQRFEWKHCRVDKSEFDAEVSLTALDVTGEKLLLAIVRDISERKQAENAIRRSEEFRRRVFDTSRMPIVIMEYATHRFIDCNPATVEIYGYTIRDEVLGKTPVDVSAEVQYDGSSSLEKARYYIEKTKAEGAVVFEWRHRRPNGELWDAEVHLMSFSADGKELLQFSLLDITGRKQLESDLRKSQANLSAILESTTDLIWSIDCDFRMLTYNSSLERYLKRNYGTVPEMGCSAADVVPPDKVPFWLNLYEQAVTEGSFRIEYEIPGTDRCLEVSFFRIISDGKIIGISIFAKDISERKRVERELLQEKAVSDVILNLMPGTFFMFEHGERLVRWNENFRKLNSKTDQELKNQSPLRNFDDVGKHKVSAAIKQTMQYGEARVEIERLNNDGTHTPYLYSAVKVTLNDIDYLVGTGTDISDLKKAEATIRESEERFRQIANNIEEIFFLLEKETRKVLYVSPAIEILFGVPLKKILDRPLMLADSIHPDDRDSAQFADLSKRYSQPINEVFRIIRPDEGIRWVRLRSFLVKNEKREVYRVAGVIADISESVQAQEAALMHQQQLIQADKMASVGMMVSGVAHEINNPNNLIMLNADVMKTIWQPAGKLLAEYIEKNNITVIAGLPVQRALDKFGTMIDGISGAAVRIQRIVQNLKDFARIDAGEISGHLQINSVIETALQIVVSVIKKATRHFSVEYGEKIPEITGNYQKLEQVFINLITNACQSLESNDKAIKVSTEYLPDDMMIKLTVSDEGKGISPEYIDKIFDPFFTTKRDSGGTGLGMSVSYGIIKEHKGHITIQSNQGVGTIVTVLLPTAEDH